MGFFARALCQTAVPSDVVISTSRQFVIRAPEREVRTQAARFAEEIRSVWVDALGLTGPWQHNVHIEFSQDARRRMRPGFSLTVASGDADQMWVQLTVSDPALIGTPELAEAVFQSLALEYTSRFYRPVPNRTARLAPQWFTQALVQQWIARRNPPPAHVIEGLLSAPKPPVLANILRQRTPIVSAADQLTFRLLSLALLRTLSESPEGKAGLRELVGRLAETEMDQAAILRAFPSFGEKPGRLERQWALTLARMAITTRVHLLSFSATEKELAGIFSFTSELPQRGNPEPERLEGPLALLGKAREPGGQFALQELIASLIQLETRAHPLYAPIVREYREIAQVLLRRPRTNLRKRIEDNIALQEGVRKAGETIADVLNAYELNRQGAGDPEFQKLLREHRKLFEPEPRRDRISRALDAFEAKERK